MTSRRSWALMAAALIVALSVASSGLVGATEVTTPPWITITHEVRAGKGLDPLTADDSNFEHILSRGGGARAKLLSQGELLVMVFESQDGAVRYSDYPGDELVLVSSGSVTVTEESSGKTMSFGVGDLFLVPKGWRGTWTNHGLYRELIVLGGDWSVAFAGKPVISGITTPQSIVPIRAAAVTASQLQAVARDGEFIKSLQQTPFRTAPLHAGDYTVMLQDAPQDGAYRYSAHPHDEYVYVQGGTTTLLAQNGARASFKAGDTFVVTRGFRGEWHFGPGYRAVVASVPTVESPVGSSPAAAISNVTDPAALFGARCTACHGLGIVAPTLAQMSRLTAAQVEAALWHGVMQETANGLDSGQRALLAQWIGGLNPNKGEPGPGVTKCARPNDQWKPAPAVDWAGWSRDNTFQRYVVDPAMTAKRVEHTTLEWALPLPISGAIEGAGNQLAVVGDRVFAANINHWVYALDAKSGCAEWTFRAEGRVRSNVAVENGILVVGDLLANVYGLDARSGRLLWQRRVDGSPSARVTGNVTLHNGVAYVPISGLQEVWSMRGDVPCCSFRGSVVALDASTGNEKWKTSMIDQPLRFLGKTASGVNRYGPSGVTVWSGISVDDKRGVVYVTTGNQFTEPRVDESDSVMALDMQTGKKRWVAALAPEQMGSQDIYVMGCEQWVDPRRPLCAPVNPKGEGDRDFGAPAAITRLADGSDLVLAGSKDGIFYALDPDTGKTKWKVRVGAGGETGGVEYGFATDGRYAFVPVSDMAPDGSAKGSFSAVELSTGKITWRVEGSTDTCSGKPTLCSNAYLSIPAVVGDVVWVGNQDGVLRAYARADGRLVWSFDTAREFTGANGATGRGGSIANGGPVVVGNHVYVMAGFGVMNIGMPGNTLLAFEVPK